MKPIRHDKVLDDFKKSKDFEHCLMEIIKMGKCDLMRHSMQCFMDLPVSDYEKREIMLAVAFKIHKEAVQWIDEYFITKEKHEPL